MNDTTAQLINPNLYARLRLFFGADEVEVLNAGEPGREEFRTCCKICKDWKPRLYINCDWGTLDSETGKRNLGKLHCHNEDCFSDFDRCLSLYEAVMSIPLPQLRAMRLRPARIITREQELQRPRDTLAAMPDPGPCIRLDTLVLAYPHHEAVTYLSGRGFDPAFIGKYWGASYCVTSPRFQQAAGRIIIPIFHTLDGTIAQVGWQARYIGDDVHGEPFNKARVPKYWTSPCLPRHLLAYNVETALQHPTVVIVEGATDVWNVGPMATAVLSTSASEHVLQLIAIGMRRHGNKAVVIVALDPQPPRRVNPRPTPHPIAKLTKRLSALLPGRVVPLYLPGECDPGSIDRRLFLRLARDAVRQRGLVADFTVRDRPPVRSLTATDEHALREHEYQQQLPRRAED